MRTRCLLLLAVALVAAPAGAGQPPAPAKPPTHEELIAKSQDADREVAAKAMVALVAAGPDAVSALTQGLWSDSYTARRNCAMLLGEIGADARGAAPSLARVMRDDNDTDARRNAARALAQVGAYGAVPALTKALKDEAHTVRMAAAGALVQLGADPQTVLPVLTKALKSARADEQVAAARILGDLGPEAVPALLAIQNELVESDAQLGYYLLEALGRIGPEAKNVVPSIQAKVKGDENLPLFRVNAAAALWRVARDEEAVKLLRAAAAGKKLSRPLPYVALWRLDRAKDTLEVFAKQLMAEDREEVLSAIEALGPHAKAAVPDLVKALSKVTNVLKGAEQPPPGFAELLAGSAPLVHALGTIGPDAKAALEPLGVLAKAKDPNLSFLAAVAQYRIDPKADHALTLAGYLEDKDHKRAAARALRQFPPTGTAVAIELRLALDSADEELRLDVAVALWRMEKNAGALKALRKLLASDDATVRQQAALDLGFEFGPAAKDAVPDLVKRLFDARAAVRSTSAEALARVGPVAKDAVPALVAVLEGDEAEFVLSAACEAVGLIAPAERAAAVAALKARLEHPAPLVRAHAALALVRLGDQSGKEEATRALTQRTYQVRITAAEALWRINKDGRATAVLIRALEESNLTGTEGDNERYMAARALGRVGADAKDAVPELLKLIDHPDEALAATARAAAKTIDPEAAKAAGIK
jgi:HEAT repeat protein